MRGKFALLCLCWYGQAHAGELVQRFNREVIYEAQAAQVLLAVPFDEALYANSALDFSDLRLVDSNNVETPYWLQKIAGSKTVMNRLPVLSEKPKLTKTGEDGIAVTLNLQKDESAYADGFTVVTNQHDFEYELQVQGSEDGENWHTLVDQGVIYDYSRYMNYGNRDIALPGNSDRYFKITVSKAVHTQVAEMLEMTRSLQGGQELQRDEKIDLRNQPLHIDRIELWRNETETVAENEHRFAYPLAGFKVNSDTEKKLTQIDIDAALLPLNGFQLTISTSNFSRDAEVQILQKHGIETHFSTVGQAQLEALHFKDFKREQTSLYFPEQRRQYYRLMIHDQDNPPLNIDDVKGIGPGYQLLFLPQPWQSYELRYGAENADRPHYDIAPIQELLRKGFQTTPASLGAVSNYAEKEGGFDLLEVLNSDWFLSMVIGVMVLVLGWSLYRVGKRVDGS
ncbi:MAG: hypothetical protein ACU836_05920 [Gammaproteobacteria bacterium]